MTQQLQACPGKARADRSVSVAHMFSQIENDVETGPDLACALGCRYDLFRRCVIQLPPSSHDTTNAPFTLTLHDPSTYALPPKGLPHRWQPLVMVANLPHVEALLCVTAEDEPVQCLLMLDSGAGGVDAMFHARAVQELGLAQTNKHGLRTLTVCCTAAQ